jgi:hypothetical protein
MTYDLAICSMSAGSPTRTNPTLLFMLGRHDAAAGFLLRFGGGSSNFRIVLRFSIA